ncbi:MAG: amidohydrolase family protein [Actinomycetota bacterium]|nr:amidohydrolase family protein [Actinomycetota bacterium]
MSASFLEELESIPLLDNHCHPFEVLPSPRDSTSYLNNFTEAHGGSTHTKAAKSVFVLRLMRRMAEVISLITGKETLTTQDGRIDADLLVRAREEIGDLYLAKRLFEVANIRSLVIDTGFPPPDRAIDLEVMADATATNYRKLLRIETHIEGLVAKANSYDELLDLLEDDLVDIRDKGYWGLKSIAGYRGGLEISPLHSRDEIVTGFNQLKKAERSGERVRLANRPLLESLVYRAFLHASRQNLPIQFHVGYGDHDVNLDSANPTKLRNLLEDPELSGANFVLLHNCWPFFREGAFLAAIYPNAYIDLSFGIPFLSIDEMETVAKAIVGTTPSNHIVYSSDGVRLPEIFYLSAIDGRSIMGELLSKMISRGEVGEGDALTIANEIFFENAWKLYGFDE